MVHSALKRKRYSGDATPSILGLTTTPSSGHTASTSGNASFITTGFDPHTIHNKPLSQSSIPRNSLLTPPRPSSPPLSGSPSVPAQDPRPSVRILLDLMTPTEFAKLLRARVQRLLARWPPPPSQLPHGLPSPTSSASSASSRPADASDTHDLGSRAILAFVSFFRSDDMPALRSLSLPDLHTHLVALQTLLSFLTARELKEIVKTRLYAAGAERDRWMAVQGVLDVMRNTGCEDDDREVDCEGDVGMGGAAANHDVHGGGEVRVDATKSEEEADVKARAEGGVDALDTTPSKPASPLKVRTDMERMPASHFDVTSPRSREQPKTDRPLKRARTIIVSRRYPRTMKASPFLVARASRTPPTAIPVTSTLTSPVVDASTECLRQLLEIGPQRRPPCGRSPTKPDPGINAPEPLKAVSQARNLVDTQPAANPMNQSLNVGQQGTSIVKMNAVVSTPPPSRPTPTRPPTLALPVPGSSTHLRDAVTPISHAALAPILSALVSGSASPAVVAKLEKEKGAMGAKPTTPAAENLLENLHKSVTSTSGYELMRSSGHANVTAGPGGDVDTDVDMDMSDEGEGVGVPAMFGGRNTAASERTKPENKNAPRVVGTSKKPVSKDALASLVNTSPAPGLNSLTAPPNILPGSNAPRPHPTPPVQPVLPSSKVLQGVTNPEPPAVKRRINRNRYPVSSSDTTPAPTSLCPSTTATLSPTTVSPVLTPKPVAPIIIRRPPPTFVPARLPQSSSLSTRTPPVLKADAPPQAATNPSTVIANTGMNDRQTSVPGPPTLQVKKELLGLDTPFSALTFPAHSETGGTLAPSGASVALSSQQPDPMEYLDSIVKGALVQNAGSNAQQSSYAHLSPTQPRVAPKSGINAAPRPKTSTPAAAGPPPTAPKSLLDVSVPSRIPSPSNGKAKAAISPPLNTDHKTFIPSAPRAMASMVPITRTVFVAPTGAPTALASLSSRVSTSLRPEGPELPPGPEGPLLPPPASTKPTVSNAILKEPLSASTKQPRQTSKRQASKTNRLIVASTSAHQRGRSNSRSASSSSSRSRSRSPSLFRRRFGGDGRIPPRHRLPRRRSSSPPSYRSKRRRSYSRSRSRHRSPSSARLPRYRPKRSPSRSTSRSPTRSPAYRRRNYSYSRPPSPSMRRESPVGQASNRRHWSPDTERHPRGRRKNRSAGSLTPPRVLPSRDHWSPGGKVNPRRLTSRSRWTPDGEDEDTKDGLLVDTDILAQPMKPRGGGGKPSGPSRRK